MLVLSRKVHERIVIDGNIVIEVVAIEKGKIRLGITAPREVPVFRQEVLEREDEKKLALAAKGAKG